MMTRAAVLKTFAPPEEAIAVEDWPVNDPQAGEVLVEMLAAPVNPADINVIEGQYGELPDLPAVVGNEGAGRILAAGPEVIGLAPGDLVVLLQPGTWAGKVTLPASQVVKLPEDLDPFQAAMMAVNPPTAFLMLRDFAELRPGDWVVQNAANSAVGCSVIQIAKARGLKTLNIVRRESLVKDLKAMGGDVVVTDDVDLRKSAKSLCGGKLARLGLNAVGGASALNVANGLESGATLVTFGGMARQPLKIPNGLLIFKDLRFCGFWLSRWKNSASPEEKSAVFQELSDLARCGKLRLPVHSTHRLEDLQKALAVAGESSRNGKVLLDLSA